MISRNVFPIANPPLSPFSKGGRETFLSQPTSFPLFNKRRKDFPYGENGTPNFAATD
jgi:hypothetical protein